MILRTIVLIIGIGCACGAAQFPAFSQQYMQRLGGAVQALDDVVADFDASANALGLTRTQALDQMTGTAFVEARRTDMERTFARHSALTADLAVLEGLGPLMRAYRLRHMADAELAKGAWHSFEPALPVTPASALFAVIGFGAGSALTLGILRACRRPLRGRGLPA